MRALARFVVRAGMHYGVDYAVYCTLPTHCHSEMCAAVIDATDPQRENDLTFRHLSTLTRVMPDVMKLLLICYVLPTGRKEEKDQEGHEEDGSKICMLSLSLSSLLLTFLSVETSRGEYLHDLFPTRLAAERMDQRSFRCLEEMVVKPVTVLGSLLNLSSHSFSTHPPRPLV